MLTKDTSLGLASRAGTILTAISVRVLPEAAQAQQGKRMPLELKKSRKGAQGEAGGTREWGALAKRPEPPRGLSCVWTAVVDAGAHTRDGSACA